MKPAYNLLSLTGYVVYKILVLTFFDYSFRGDIVNCVFAVICHAYV